MISLAAVLVGLYAGAGFVSVQHLETTLAYRKGYTHQSNPAAVL